MINTSHHIIYPGFKTALVLDGRVPNIPLERVNTGLSDSAFSGEKIPKTVHDLF